MSVPVLEANGRILDQPEDMLEKLGGARRMIAYASRTGNVRYIVSQLQLPGIEIGEDTMVEEPFLLLTYTDGLGDVPSSCATVYGAETANIAGAWQSAATAISATTSSAGLATSLRRNGIFRW